MGDPGGSSVLPGNELVALRVPKQHGLPQSPPSMRSLGSSTLLAQQ